ncbi:ankyrin repeat domain-containing protein [Mycobacterium sp. 3519A]|uniref:ankyrin repeat domain-containing protein n=1 Tax=Mycobacterium sp. 3519A TaxID=2057184 RepID=UPI000C7CDD5F|nr:ankyrin repeat domain-containing protein [Mycobacterium sp. 3519A]
MLELARYQEGPASVTVSRDGDDLVFWSSDTDDGRTITEESRMPVADFVAKGQGPWPWYDLGARRAGTLMVLDALGVDPPAWTTPLPTEVLDLFRRARSGSTEVIELLAWGAEPDPLDPCGATPLWYGVRSPSAGIVVALIDAGADAGRRIALSARGERFTTILHEIVRLGRTVALSHALAHGIGPDLTDSDGATPLHVVDGNNDHVNPELVRALVRAGAAVDAATPSGRRPIEQAARRILPATVAALVELGADPGAGLDALLPWWAGVGARYSGYRAGDVAAVVEILRSGGAEVTDRHRELAAEAGASQVEAALRG